MIHPPTFVLLPMACITGVAQTPTDKDFDRLFKRASIQFTLAQKKQIKDQFRSQPIENLLRMFINRHEQVLKPHWNLAGEFSAKVDALLAESDSKGKSKRLLDLYDRFRNHRKSIETNEAISLAPGALHYYKAYRAELGDSEELSIAVESDAKAVEYANEQMALSSAATTRVTTYLKSH